MSSDRLRVILADDHQLIAEGIRSLLVSRFEVIDVVEDGSALLKIAEASRPDIILTDISMPGIDGLEATRQLREKLPDVPVIILTMHDDEGHVREALKAGAAGYLVKTSAPRELFEAIKEVLAGRLYVTSSVACKLVGSAMSTKPAVAKSEVTPRELEISSLVAQGLESVEIAERLCIAEVTVRTHLRRILRKLGLRNRVELTRYALAQGWTSLDKEKKDGRACQAPANLEPAPYPSH